MDPGATGANVPPSRTARSLQRGPIVQGERHAQWQPGTPYGRHASLSRAASDESFVTCQDSWPQGYSAGDPFRPSSRANRHQSDKYDNIPPASAPSSPRAYNYLKLGTPIMAPVPLAQPPGPQASQPTSTFATPIHSFAPLPMDGIPDNESRHNISTYPGRPVQYVRDPVLDEPPSDSGLLSTQFVTVTRDTRTVWIKLEMPSNIAAANYPVTSAAECRPSEPATQPESQRAAPPSDAQARPSTPIMPAPEHILERDDKPRIGDKTFLLDLHYQVLLSCMLRLPMLYFSRVTQIFQEADLTVGELKWMCLNSTESKFRRILHAPSTDLEHFRALLPLYCKFQGSWELFVEALLKEWKTFNIISALLMGAILTLFQIPGVAEDSTIKFLALLSLLYAMISLLFGCMYIIRFGTMRRTYVAVEWAFEAQKLCNPLWNIWTLLALPVIWLTWSITLFLACIFSYTWRSISADGGAVPYKWNDQLILAARIIFAGTFAMAILYGVFVIRTFRRWGSIAQRQWYKRVRDWDAAQSALPEGKSVEYEPPAPSSATNVPLQEASTPGATAASSEIPNNVSASSSSTSVDIDPMPNEETVGHPPTPTSAPGLVVEPPTPSPPTHDGRFNVTAAQSQDREITDDLPPITREMAPLPPPSRANSAAESMLTLSTRTTNSQLPSRTSSPVEPVGHLLADKSSQRSVRFINQPTITHPQRRSGPSPERSRPSRSSRSESSEVAFFFRSPSVDAVPEVDEEKSDIDGRSQNDHVEGQPSPSSSPVKASETTFGATSAIDASSGPNTIGDETVQKKAKPELTGDTPAPQQMAPPRFQEATAHTETFLLDNNTVFVDSPAVIPMEIPAGGGNDSRRGTIQTESSSRSSPSVDAQMTPQPDADSNHQVEAVEPFDNQEPDRGNLEQRNRSRHIVIDIGESTELSHG